MFKRKISQFKEKLIQRSEFLIPGVLLVIFSLLLLPLIYYFVGPYFWPVTFYFPLFIGLSILFIKKIYRAKEKFLKIYGIMFDPLFNLLIFIFLSIGLGYNVLTIPDFFLLSLLLSLSFYFFAFIVECFWLRHLKTKEHRHQTVWTFYINQKNFKWYLLLLLAGILIAIFSGIRFGIAGNIFGVVFTIHYFVLVAATTFPLLSENSIREYCKKSLIVLKEGLSPNKAAYKLFPTIVDEFNTLAKKVYFPEEPSITNSDKYTKALFLAVTSMDEERLNVAEESVEEMKGALDTQPKKSMFLCFINGLNQLVTGKKLKPQEQPKNMFEMKTGFEKTLKWIRERKVLSIIFMILIVSVPTYVTIRTQAPELGFRAFRWLGENNAKLIFPIGEASIVEPSGSIEVIPSWWGGGDRLNGGGSGEYSFNVLNEHRRSIRTTDINIAGPTPITQIYIGDGGATQVLSAENVEFEIIDVTIESPRGLIILEEYTSEIIVAKLHVAYDLRGIREALEARSSDQINIYGLLQIQVSYEIMGEDIRENIFGNVNVNFILPTAFFLE